MAHFKKLIERENVGKITYGENVVDEIVFHAVNELTYAKLYSVGNSGIPHSTAIRVNFDKDGVHVGVVVKVHYTQSISEMAFKIQETIRYNVEAMTEYHVANVNVTVKGVLFEEIPVAPVDDADEIENETSQKA